MENSKFLKIIGEKHEMISNAFSILPQSWSCRKIFSSFTQPKPWYRSDRESLVTPMGPGFTT